LLHIVKSDNSQKSATALALSSQKAPHRARVSGYNMSSKIDTREFSITDYDAAVQVWQRVEGVEITEGDDRKGIAAFLARNPGLSRVAIDGPAIVGVALCGDDGRRGHIYHLAVDPAFQGRGLVKRLLDECLDGLRRAGVQRVIIMVAGDNRRGSEFWQRYVGEEIPGALPMGIDVEELGSQSQFMKVGGRHFQTIWITPDEGVVQLIDQRFLPHRFMIEEVRSVEQMAAAIREMHVRGAGLIGVSAGYGMYLAAIEAAARPAAAGFDEHVERAAEQLRETRPTAVNLSWATERQLRSIATGKTAEEKVALALRTANSIAEEDVEHCRMIGQQGLALIQEIARRKTSKPVNVLTHCNAGWLAFVDYGSATAPIYAAHDSGLPLHVWVAETRPRNQGSKLTAWELSQHGVPHRVIADSAAGHLMQRGEVDLVIVGTDRTTYTGDVANKIGTYLKALAAKANNVPFYVALPSASIDWEMRDGLKEIPIEERGAEEITHVDGWFDEQQVEVRIVPEGSPAANYGFDVTPRHLVTGLITERGVCEANEKSIRALFPEHAT